MHWQALFTIGWYHFFSLLGEQSKDMLLFLVPYQCCSTKRQIDYGTIAIPWRFPLDFCFTILQLKYCTTKKTLPVFILKLEVIDILVLNYIQSHSLYFLSQNFLSFKIFANWPKRVKNQTNFGIKDPLFSQLISNRYYVYSHTRQLYFQDIRF